MISLTIDSLPIVPLREPKVLLSYDAAKMRSVESAAESVVADIEVVADYATALVASGEGELHVGEGFNRMEHTAEIAVDGVVVISGDVVLLSSNREVEGVVYTFRLTAEGAEWAVVAAQELVHELPIDYTMRLSLANIVAGWEGDDPVKFLPVHRDSYTYETSSVALDLVRKLRSVDDYHPFLNLYDMLYCIFESAGYSVVSNFMESEEFRRLYMSGAYVSQSSTAAKSAMDFCVKRLSDSTSTADSRGRVTMSPMYYSNSVGYIVDYESIASDEECYSFNSCFTVEDSVLTFTPTTQITAGFEFRIKYISDYTIKDRDSLRCFDTFYLESDDDIEITVTNHLDDQRDCVVGNFSYLAVVFDHVDGRSYRIVADVDGVSTVLASWSSRCYNLVTPNVDTSLIGELVLEYLDSGSSYSVYEDDWALYMGYADESGEVEVDVTLRTPPESISPTSPKRFYAPYVQGAESGMSFTLCEGTKLTPYFASYPGIGSWVEFEDLSQHEAYQSAVIESVRHLFNLAIYSDDIHKVVYVEPMEELFDSSKVWDWSDRIIAGSSILIADLATESRREQKWGYQQADGVTNRSSDFDYVPGETYPTKPDEDPEQSVANSYSPEYGSWCVSIENYAAADSMQSSLNPLFSPTQNDTLGVPIVGDRDDLDVADTLEFSPRVVALLGMQESNNETIPYATFHSEEDGVTLCFEDRDGVTGLNRYYSDDVARDESGQMVTLSLRIEPNDFVTLMSPHESTPNVLSTFGFTIGGEWCECRLESIEEYDASQCVARCKFLIVK